MAETTYYEVRCPSCKTSFPPETRRCIHCGGPLGGGLRGFLTAGAGPSPAEAEQEEAELPFQRGRSIVWAVTAVIALVLSMLRACAERG